MTFFQPPIGFVFSRENLPGVVAANSFVSLFNPVASDRLIIVGGVFISAVANAASASTAPMRAIRINSASGGTLHPVTDIGKFITARPDPVAEVRTGNPAVGMLDAQLLNAPPPTSTGAFSSGNVNQITVPPGFGGFTLAAGEGIVLRTGSGDIAQRWNISIVWGER